MAMVVVMVVMIMAEVVVTVMVVFFFTYQGFQRAMHASGESHPPRTAHV